MSQGLDQVAALTNIQNALLHCQQEVNDTFDPTRCPIIRMGSIVRLGESWVFPVSIQGTLVAQVGRPYSNDTFKIHNTQNGQTFECNNIELVVDAVQYIARDIFTPMIDAQDIEQATLLIEERTGKKVKLVDPNSVGQVGFGGDSFPDLSAHDVPKIVGNVAEQGEPLP